jgi:hypothetical protein
MTSIKELWMLLGEKDVQIYELLKEIEVLKIELENVRKLVPTLGIPFKEHAPIDTAFKDREVRKNG